MNRFNMFHQITFFWKTVFTNRAFMMLNSFMDWPYVFFQDVTFKKSCFTIYTLEGLLFFMDKIYNSSPKTNEFCQPIVMKDNISYFFLNQSQERLNRYQIRSCTNKVKYLSSFWWATHFSSTKIKWWIHPTHTETTPKPLQKYFRRDCPYLMEEWRNQIRFQLIFHHQRFLF